MKHTFEEKRFKLQTCEITVDGTHEWTLGPRLCTYKECKVCGLRKSSGLYYTNEAGTYIIYPPKTSCGEILMRRSLK